MSEVTINTGKVEIKVVDEEKLNESLIKVDGESVKTVLK